MTTTDIKKLTFEEALAELEAIVSSLESGKAPLQDAMTSYERGTALKKHCEAKLKAAQMKIEKITLTDDGQVTTEEISIE